VNRVRQRVACALAAVAVVVFYFWMVRAAGSKFEWGADLNGYYDFLGRAFAGGHLYLPVEPSPQLLAQPDPWDPKVDDSLKWQDMVLYHRHYYLYFGAAPAVLLFAPFRILTRHDLPENFAIFLLCSVGFLFWVGAFLRLLRMAGAEPAPWLLTLMVLALGIAQSVPYLLNRVAVYEIAIAGGYFCLAAGIYFLARRWLAAAGVAFATAVACRPHLLFAGVVALVVLAIWNGRRVAIPFLVAFALAGLAIAAYNYERFDNPLEFGFRYQLAGPGQNRVEVAPRNFVPGLYYMLLSRPEWSPVFPWMRMVFRFPFDSAALHPLPPEYFVEPTVGALWITPFLLAAFWIPRNNAILWVAAVSAAAVLLFLMLSHLATHRYEVDFLPLAVFAAISNLAIRISRMGGVRRAIWSAAAACLIVYSVVANLALAIQGPYDDVLRNRPARYLRIAKWFSPTTETRPAEDPRISVNLSFQCSRDSMGMREPLITMGHSHFHYFLFVEKTGNKLKLISKSEELDAGYDLPDAWTRPVALRLDYSPESHQLTVELDGQAAIQQHISKLITAPAEVEIGHNLRDLGLTARRFTGALHLSEKTVVAGR